MKATWYMVRGSLLLSLVGYWAPDGPKTPSLQFPALPLPDPAVWVLGTQAGCQEMHLFHFLLLFIFKMSKNVLYDLKKKKKGTSKLKPSQDTC